MRIALTLPILLLLAACSKAPGSHGYSQVSVRELYRDSISVRTLEVMPGSVGFAGSDGLFGSISLPGFQVRTGRLGQGDTLPEFRATAHTAADFFVLSAGSPALLYKTGEAGRMELAYEDRDPEVFYDAMAFWDDRNGIAVGDAMDGCLSILLTRDGGTSWRKLPCDSLPPALEGEGAFAASNTNIAIWERSCWIATTAGRIFYSPDLGAQWEVIQSPVAHDRPTQGIYSLAFADAQTGYAIGGDYTLPEEQIGNKARTTDGGSTWELVASGKSPGYKSCVQYVPGSGGADLVAVGFTGIDYSQDGGNTWERLSEEPFYTMRFLNDSVAVAAGRGRLARLVFSR